MADNLNGLLQEGAGYVYAAYGTCATGDVPPVGKVPPGQTLQQFWHLGTPAVAGWTHLFIPPPPKPNLDRPEVNELLRDMLRIRRLSPAELSALTARVNMLPAAMGRGDGGFAAATLLGRMQQALSQPSAFVPLMTDNELRKEYADAKRFASGFSTATDLDTGLTGAGVVGSTLGKTMPDHWAGRVVTAIQDTGPAKTLQDGVGLAGNWSAAKKTGVVGLMWLYTKFILGRGASEENALAQECRDEMIRRGMPAP